MSSASNIDVAKRFALAVAERLVESQDIDTVTARLRNRLRAAPEGDHLLLVDILAALAEHTDHPETKAVSRH